MSVGPLDVGYLATTANDGLSSPSAAAYADFPEPCALAAAIFGAPMGLPGDPTQRRV